MGRDTLREIRDTFRVFRDGLGHLLKGLGRVGGPSGRSGTGWRIVEEVRDGSGDPWGGPGLVDGP